MDVASSINLQRAIRPATSGSPPQRYERMREMEIVAPVGIPHFIYDVLASSFRCQNVKTLLLFGMAPLGVGDAAT
jgi:hypothetical protein